MPECPYCDRSFEGETAIRKHFYVDHDREELSRIDTRRVDAYLRDQGVTEPEPAPDPAAAGSDFESVYEAVRETMSPWNPAKRWEPGEIRELSADEIVDRLADLGIHTDREQFRRRAEKCETVHTLASEWLADEWVTAAGYEQAFVWMAGVILWDRWAADIERADRILELAMEANEHEAEGDHLTAYERTYDAWKEFERVTNSDVIALEAAIEGWDGPVDVLELCEALAHPPRNDAWGEPARAELRLEFCRGVLDRYPTTAVPLHRFLRLGEAEALFVLGRPDEADEVYESLLEADPTDARIYAEWGTLYRRGCPPAGIPPDEERAIDIYGRGRDDDAEPGELLIELLERPRDGAESPEPESDGHGESGGDGPPRLT